MAVKRRVPTEGPVPEEEAIDPALRRLTWVLVLGALAPALDTTIVNVALAAIGSGLHASVSTTQWTITGYLLAAGMAMPVTGWAAQRFGAKRLWLFSLGAFMLGSALSGAAWDASSLIIFRLFQGAAAGLMLPVVTTLLVQAAGPKRLGRLMGMATLPLVVVPIFGPVVGGLIVNNLGWRWIFYVNVPICLVAMFLAWRFVPGGGPKGQGLRLDVLGLALVSPAVALVVYGLAQASGPGGFAGRAAFVPLLAGAVLGCVFVGYALRKKDAPIINLRVFKSRSYSASMTVFFLAGLSLYGPLLVLALFYQDVQAKSALAAGLLLAPQGIGSMLPRTVAGKLTDRTGPRMVVLTSLVLAAAGTLPFAFAGPHTSDWLLAAFLLVRGAGLAGATIAVMAGAFHDVARQDVADASTISRIVQQVGGSFGASVLAMILAEGLLGHEATTAARAAAFGSAFWWATGFAVLALVPALLLPHRAKAPVH